MGAGGKRLGHGEECMTSVVQSRVEALALPGMLVESGFCAPRQRPGRGRLRACCARGPPSCAAGGADRPPLSKSLPMPCATRAESVLKDLPRHRRRCVRPTESERPGRRSLPLPPAAPARGPQPMSGQP